MLEKLTPEQEARLPEFRDFGLNIGLSTERTDRVAADAAIRAHYRACGLAEPKEILWFDSPYASVRDSVGDSVGASVWASVWDSVRDSVWASVRDSVRESVGDSVRDSVWASVWDSVRDSVRESVWDSVRASVWDSIGAHYDANDASWFMAWDQYGISLPPSALTMIEVSRHVWWYYPGREIVYASDRPTKIARDDEGRLHCENGKAIEFADGKGFSAWHGQTIPDEWVTGSPPEPAKALHWPNMDQRAAACEIVGWHNILDQLQARTIDDSGDPVWGRLVEVDLPESGKERFLDALCGTGRRFALPVPPDTASVDAAQSILHGGLPVEILKHCVERT